MDAVADLQALDVDDDGMRDLARLAHDIDVVAHDVEHAAALDAGRQPFVLEVHGHMHAHASLVGDAHEIDMNRHVGDRIEGTSRGSTRSLLPSTLRSKRVV
jgi:hypothetical protein